MKFTTGSHSANPRPKLRDADEKTVKVVSRRHLDRLARKSKEHRANSQQIKLHRRTEQIERVITVLQPETYVKPHRHGNFKSPGFEFLTVLKGKLGVLLFYQEGGIVQILRAGTTGPLRGIEIPDGIFHTVIALAPNTTILEVRSPQSAKACEFLDTFPEPGENEVEALMIRWQNYFKTAKNPKLRR